MAYTAHGQQQRAKLVNAATNLNEMLLVALRPVVEGIPPMIVERVLSTGGGTKSFSTPYSRGWEYTRKQSGKQTSKKDFWFEGNMWRSFVLVEEKVTPTGVTFVMASNNADARGGGYLVDIHSDRERELGNVKDNILEMTKAEEEEVFKEIIEIAKQTLSNVL